MKKLQKILSVVLVFVMVLGVGASCWAATAFADDEIIEEITDEGLDFLGESTTEESTASGNLIFNRVGTDVTVSWNAPTGVTGITGYVIAYIMPGSAVKEFQAAGTSYTIANVPTTSAVSVTVYYSTEAGGLKAGTVGSGTTGGSTTTGTTISVTGGLGTAVYNNGVLTWTKLLENYPYTISYYLSGNSVKQSATVFTNSWTVPTGTTSATIECSLGTVCSVKFNNTGSTSSAVNTLVYFTVPVYLENGYATDNYKIVFTLPAYVTETKTVVEKEVVTVTTVRDPNHNTYEPMWLILEDGSPILDEEGNKIPVTDEEGNIVYTDTVLFPYVETETTSPASVTTNTLSTVYKENYSYTVSYDGIDYLLGYEDKKAAFDNGTKSAASVAVGSPMVSTTTEVTEMCDECEGKCVHEATFTVTTVTTVTETPTVTMTNSFGTADYEIQFGTLAYSWDGISVCLPQSILVGDNASLNLYGRFTTLTNQTGATQIINANSFMKFTQASELLGVNNDQRPWYSFSNYIDGTGNVQTNYNIKAVAYCDGIEDGSSYCWDWQPAMYIGSTGGSTSTGTVTTNGTNCTVISTVTSSYVTWPANGSNYYHVIYTVGGTSKTTTVSGTAVTLPVGHSTSFQVTIIDSSNTVIGTATVNQVGTGDIPTVTTPVITSAVGGDNTATITWTAVTGASYYKVFFANDGSNKYYQKATVSGTTAMVTNLAPGTYKVRVKALVGDEWTALADCDYVKVTVTDHETSVEEVIPGDLTGDGVVNIMDVLRLAKYVAGWDVEIY